MCSVFPPDHVSAKGITGNRQLGWLQSSGGHLWCSHKGPAEGSTEIDDHTTRDIPCTHHHCCATTVAGLLASPRSALRANSWLISRQRTPQHRTGLEAKLCHLLKVSQSPHSSFPLYKRTCTNLCSTPPHPRVSQQKNSRWGQVS